MVTMSEVWPRVRDWILPPIEKTLSAPEEDLGAFARRLAGTQRVMPWRIPTVAQALGVPSIRRAVDLIASTTGMLSVQGFRNGAVMDDPPRLIVRPDPYQTPQAFYGGTAACKAKYGEFVWWIANRDSAGFASALVLVPLNELQVTDNPENRLLPTYRWGLKVGTRFSGANPGGAFVHVMDALTEPLALRGEGPLQQCRAATSVTVEAQEWAANFYADGGNPSIVIKTANELSPMRLNPDTYEPDDENGLNEAQRLKAEWVNQPHNVPRVVDSNIEKIEYMQPNEGSAQMLTARGHQDGDSARMFGIPGPLLEYSMAGGSLVYQNRAELMTNFTETCLHPVYLEPIEQALSDLLPRSITARFNVKGFLRADVKTRYEVHQIAITAGIYDAAYAQQEEGIVPGDIEYAPVPFSPPAAVPAPLIRASMDVRCDGTVGKSSRGLRSLDRCNRLLSREGVFVGRCPRCKKDYPAAAA